jgi:hypothetical protein
MKWLGILAAAIGWSPAMWGIPPWIAAPIYICLVGFCLTVLHQRKKWALERMEIEQRRKTMPSLFVKQYSRRCSPDGRARIEALKARVRARAGA